MNAATPSPIYQVASDYVDRYAALDPCAATAMGVGGHEAEMTDYSPEGEERRGALRRETVARLLAAPSMGERDRVAREAMVAQLELAEETAAAGEHLRNLSIIRSAARSIRGVFDLMLRTSGEDWRMIAERLGLVPAGLESSTRALQTGLARGLPAAIRQVEANLGQMEAWAGVTPGSRSFFAGLVDEFDRSATKDLTLRADLERGASAATAAFASFATFLRDQYLPGATPRDAVGPERYQLGSRAYNGLVLDLEETYAWGWDELARIEREMRETCARITPGATLSIEETKAFLESDPARAIEGEEAFRQWMQDLQDRTIAELDGRHFDIAAPLRRIEAMIAPPGGALAMYYTGPSEDFRRPGRTWYPTGGKTRFPLWGEVSIAYHEGVPGHHLQVATTKYLAEQLSRYQRLMGGTSGYVEGWALYAERLMGELGYLQNPDYYLGMLRAQAMRAVRIILDIGLHLELAIPAGADFYAGEQWTAELADVFARERSQFPADFMASEVVRYLGTPGQGISYKVGERAWLAARESARKRLGEGFDLKRWHRAALELGPMGLAQLQREMGTLAC